MAISFLNPDNNLLLGEDTLQIQGLNGIKELIIVGPSDIYVRAQGVEISKDNEHWTDEIFFAEMLMQQPLFVRPTDSTTGQLTAEIA